MTAHPILSVRHNAEMLYPAPEAQSGAPDAAAPQAAGREPSPAWHGSGRVDGPDNCPAAKLASLRSLAVARSRELGLLTASRMARRC